jgi:hypothetical protein
VGPPAAPPATLELAPALAAAALAAGALVSVAPLSGLLEQPNIQHAAANKTEARGAFMRATWVVREWLSRLKNRVLFETVAP